MPRADLLALTHDDLSALTNRGTVRRAERELEENEVTGAVTESADGSLEVTWSDGPACQIAAGQPLAQGRCSCAAIGLCRHLVRTVLAYQRSQSTPVLADEAIETPVIVPADSLWDPGTISDETLGKLYRPAQLTKLRTQFEAGILAELVRSAKPMARFHQPTFVIRFLVPHDPHYARCDCGEPAPCAHVPLAIWAYRRLALELHAGMISTGGAAVPIAAELLDEIETCLTTLAAEGLAGVGRAWTDQLARLEARCRSAGLLWPAETIADLADQQRRYAEHDALFSPERVVDAVGELLARTDAIRNDTAVLPQSLIRGTGENTTGRVGKSRFIGLGCDVSLGQRGGELTAYLQDVATGTMAVTRRSFTDPEPTSTDEPRSFAAIARAPAVKGASFADLGRGQLLTDAAKRTAGGVVSLTRTNASVQPQNFVWETVRPPVLLDDFGELADRLTGLPPSALRPRRAAEDFHVLAVARVEAAGFDSITQTTVASLLDSQGRHAYLAHPFTVRGRAGTEALLARLREPASSLRFVSGSVRRTPSGIVIYPVACVFETGSGRVAVQPWVDDPGLEATSELVVSERRSVHPVTETFHELAQALDDLFTAGLRRPDDSVARRWQELQHRCETVGLVRLATITGRLNRQLQNRASTLRWDPQPAARVLERLALLLRIARDVGWPE